MAIARTLPELDDRPGSKGDRVTNLPGCDWTSGADVYIETQYLASRKIDRCYGLSFERTRAAPEIILVLPKTTEGWLEHKAMDGARHRLLHQLWKADLYKRLGVYYPVTAGGNRFMCMRRY